MALSTIEFLEPWEQFVPGQAEVFVGELERELSLGHPLRGMSLIPLGHSRASDDALFGTEDGRVVEVHLTFSNRAEQPPLPRHRIYSTPDEWAHEVVKHEGR